MPPPREESKSNDYSLDPEDKETEESEGIPY
jgi:hypothetical protein